MTVETYLVESIKDRYGEEVAAEVNRNLQYWAEQKKAEDTSEFAETLQNYIYPYIAAAEVLLKEGINGEEAKAFISGLVENGPRIAEN